ncbi:hypothetical protein GG804_14435 [Sphingomonas histidinilytica]|uniref:DUF1214 domain-containing protein n=1 Tax=Rhizorhabdus histidinilytica TaxID=439228 RepID=A0A1T5DZC9_9SPHN|nr:hypothetical protein [Rhizorhabdus histidinilytica]MBO9377968.1 hypothetical protein [Rhizorhabdus histidinilytica]SKB76994.1 hypothetical protein SAMN06295920_10641 [Rhizorhabdus histidinilytica]
MNPIATTEQARFEREALTILADPRMQATIADRRAYWLDEARPSPAMRQAFEWAYPEVVFGAIIWSLNTDAQRPGVVTITRLPHRLDGVDVPGSRWGIDNPDSVYRVIPIDGAERYVIRGRVADPRLTENYFTLWDAHMGTVDVLDGKALVLDADGRFEIFVDADEKGDRANHVRSSPEAVEFYIRDVIADWARERPNMLSVERLGGAPRTPERDFDRKLADAQAMLVRNVDNTMRWNAQATTRPANGFDFTIDRDSDGALRNQIYIMGHFDLADDEALLISIGLGGAGYFLAPITNIWGTTNDIVDRTSSLNLTQSVRDDADSLTYVVSRRDPGVWNWLDPCDLPEGLLTLRWAEFADGRPGAGFGARSRVVKLDALRGELPAGTRWVTPEERRTQQRERAASYAWRIEA